MEAIKISDLSFIYSKKTPYEKLALDNVSVVVNEGEFLGVIGHTGSGKSTFIQHLNGLIKAQSGNITVFDIDLNAKKPKPDLRKLRSQVGMVFQYPEYQLFDETVAKDVAFGCKNLKLDKAEIEIRVKEAIETVGLDYAAVKDRSPFDLSGGQKRRAAIAGVIAMRPRVLVLDEPTAGLDPQGKKQILDLIVKLKQDRDLTIIVVSHDMDEIVRYADRIIVFGAAKIAYDLPMKELFTHDNDLVNIGLDIPLAVKLANKLRERGIDLGGGIVNDDDIVKAVVKYAMEVKGIYPDRDKLRKIASDNASKQQSASTSKSGDIDIFGGIEE